SQGIATEEPPPALLQIEPARPFRDEHLLDARMFSQPSTGLGTIVSTEIIGDHVDCASGIGHFNVSQQGNVALRVARCGTAGDLLAITNPQCAIHPDLLLAAAVIQRSFDAMPICRPPRCRRERPWD